MRILTVRVYASSLHKDPLRVPIESSTEHPLCVQCRHYIQPTFYGNNVQDKKKGYCARSGMMHVIDGSIEYEKVDYYRQYTCKGVLHEPIVNTIIPEEEDMVMCLTPCPIHDDEMLLP